MYTLLKRQYTEKAGLKNAYHHANWFKCVWSVSPVPLISSKLASRKLTAAN